MEDPNGDIGLILGLATVIISAIILTIGWVQYNSSIILLSIVVFFIMAFITACVSDSTDDSSEVTNSSNVGTQTTVQRQRNVPLNTRTMVLERDNYTCQMCGRTRYDGVKLEVDHIIPVAKGGSDNINNLQTLCFDCNRGKSDKILPNQMKK